MGARARDYPRSIVTVELVFTERRSDMTESRARNFERLRERVAAASGAPVDVSHYEDVDPRRLASASSIVLSGSTAAWSARRSRRSRCSAKPCARRNDRRSASAEGCSSWRGLREGRSTSERALSTDSSRSGSTIAATCCATCPKTPSCSRITPMRSRSCPRGFASSRRATRARCRRSRPPSDAWWGTQFHPEESNAEHPAGERVLGTFFTLA